MRVWRKRRTCLVRLLIVEGEQFHSILGRNACIELGCLKICDNDALHKPTALGAQVYATQQVAADVPLTIDDLKRNYQTVFSGDVGKLPGQYRIQLDTSVHPVKHTHRPVAVTMGKRVKSTLYEMAAKDITEPGTTATEWISSMVVVPKKSGQLRVCLDPKDLNAAIQREHHTSHRGHRHSAGGCKSVHSTGRLSAVLARGAGH